MANSRNRSQSPVQIAPLQSRYITKINKLLPAGYKLEPDTTRRPSSCKPDSRKSSKKRVRGRQKERVWVKSNFQWTDRQWGLKVGGEPARKCNQIIQSLKKHPLSGPFLQAVDPVALNLPNYLEIIQDPIDLSTVERNLKSGMYSSAQQFAVDVRRIWLNSFTYNATHSDMFYITLQLSSHFERLYKDLEGMVFSPDPQIKRIPVDHSLAKNYMNKPMGVQERKVLAANLKKLNKEQMKIVQEIITGKKSKIGMQQCNIGKLSHRVCRELEKFVKLQYQTSVHASRQRSISAKRQYQLEQEYYAMPEKKPKRNFYDEMEYY